MCFDLTCSTKLCLTGPKQATSLKPSGRPLKNTAMRTASMSCGIQWQKHVIKATFLPTNRHLLREKMLSQKNKWSRRWRDVPQSPTVALWGEYIFSNNHNHYMVKPWHLSRTQVSLISSPDSVEALPCSDTLSPCCTWACSTPSSPFPSQGDWFY